MKHPPFFIQQWLSLAGNTDRSIEYIMLPGCGESWVLQVMNIAFLVLVTIGLLEKK
ncbi:hypothetical protein Q5741_06995 [Paenibacillus sp. JX-17]|uniref:Uncharacterized protein n=1 Tax=Paenibacillus lacisoli TaxID=3064525 RepID=A0ABT9CA76_9BACL|nr:hypothetical protein [Paenibacillus sp. JX-17]MDO7906165.1 hypothetical protein [Paenibacillus sp. JX-17]